MHKHPSALIPSSFSNEPGQILNQHSSSLLVYHKMHFIYIENHLQVILYDQI